MKLFLLAIALPAVGVALIVTVQEAMLLARRGQRMTINPIRDAVGIDELEKRDE